MGEKALGKRLLELYRRLSACYGAQHWWPAEGPLEVMVGAILTQQTTWRNVEKAIASLKAEGALSPAGLRLLIPQALSQLIRPCGYYNAKALKLKALASWLGSYEDDLSQIFSRELWSLREELLSLYGIGEETADSILLYAAGKPIFVVDAYTRRILRRLGLGPEVNSYRAFQAFFMENLPHEPELFNEFHALFVRHGKEVCRSLPRCQECSLQELCLTFRRGSNKI